ncbi:2-iminobutanoate/2-iminopropanoate deaminase isoform X3 [Canis lupus baileyi]|uniref:2-iminobutanoate/2-iminopropanoate deaminase isoform X2 n=1 Tax=Canis lupus dingo TaxID=286419 RepID=UPI000BAA162C|nr:2-iminobutanoate/2-iminopropanoate deaminase isoform X2 [Canis lupus dingo]|eukprot:XP_022282258.1 2-iminobutanoate/2-iminopropanoate deaminase isoform X2 [Canis lupus familiaris]
MPSELASGEELPPGPVPGLLSLVTHWQRQWTGLFSWRGSKIKGLAMASLIRKVISTAKAPGAIGPYSQAVLVDRTIYISGQLGMDPSSGQLVPGGVAEEAKQALTNMGEILKAAGCDFTNVVKTTVLLADINDFNTVNEVYKQWRPCGD